jgi:pilus assembly protein Flp/PilA
MKALAIRFAKDQSGATAIEYGLIAAGIAVAIVVAVQAVGGQLNVLFGDVKTKLGGQ